MQRPMSDQIRALFEQLISGLSKEASGHNKTIKGERGSILVESTHPRGFIVRQSSYPNAITLTINLNHNARAVGFSYWTKESSDLRAPREPGELLLHIERPNALRYKLGDRVMTAGETAHVLIEPVLLSARAVEISALGC
jgi:hypothetical protein